MTDPRKIVRNPNGIAYTEFETRNGPPLEYVGEKIGSALSQLHKLLGALSNFQKNGYLCVDASSEPDAAERLYDIGCEAFGYQVIGYLALHNRLGLASEARLIERLLEMDGESFDSWSYSVSSEGSVFGSEV